MEGEEMEEDENSIRGEDEETEREIIEEEKDGPWGKISAGSFTWAD